MPEDEQATKPQAETSETGVLGRLNKKSREELLTALYDIWKFGQDYGGIDTDVVGTIVRNVTKDERKMIEGWLQQEIQPGQGSEWRNQSLASFLVKLKEELDKREM